MDGPLSTKFIVWLLATILYLTSLYYSIKAQKKTRSHNGIFYFYFSPLPCHSSATFKRWAV